jgi:cysteine desulfurase
MGFDVIYLDCNATTPLEPEVEKIMIHYLSAEFGNAGSRTHEFGLRAKQAVQKARTQIADVVGAEKDEVIFTSGATESNNLAILGLAAFGLESGKKHIISTQIEHKAVLEPLQILEERGFEITLVPPNKQGWVDPNNIKECLRDDTLLVSVMHVNNETGIIQPVVEIAELLKTRDTIFHVDAAQSFGKDIDTLMDKRIDLMSISAHKVYGPKGVGALVMRKRGYDRLPLQPLMFGGGQERKLRPGTLPVHLIAGLGLAAELAKNNCKTRREKCELFRKNALSKLGPLNPVINGLESRVMPHVLNISFPGVDNEALMVALKDIIAISNGSACSSHSYTPSHVLKAMQLSEEIIKGTVRISWCHMTKAPDWDKVVKTIESFI